VSVPKRHAPGRMLWWTLAVVALLRLATLGLYPLTDTTEARYAEVARKMVELNDWVTPWYDYGVPFWAKPPLSTWLTAASLKLFGINEFAARLPYFLLAVLIAWLVWEWLGRSSRRAALLAVSLLSGTMLYFIASAAVMTDLALVLGTTLAMRGFWAAFEAPELARPHKKWLLFVGLGIGMLAKGPIAVVLTGIPIVLWCLVTGNVVAAWKRLPWIKGGVLTVAIALPWYWLAEIRTPGFWEYFFIGEHWKRFTVTGWAGDKYGTAHATARGSIWLLAIAACLPWPVLLPFLAIGRKAARRFPRGNEQNMVEFSPATATAPAPRAQSLAALRQWNLYLLAWAAAPCLFFTLSGNILWTYVLPALPALAMLAAGWLAMDTRTRRIDALVLVGVAVMALLVAAYFINEQLADSWKTAKTAVVQYQVRNKDNRPLLFIGDLPYSASFYSQGRAKAVAGNAELARRLAAGHVFVALTPAQAQQLTPELKAGLHLAARSGAYDLYSSGPEQPR
jgi:4-amino-4-deoxy-L-arabinose transferase-like glycosyltransferase